MWAMLYKLKVSFIRFFPCILAFAGIVLRKSGKSLTANTTRSSRLDVVFDAQSALHAAKRSRPQPGVLTLTSDSQGDTPAPTRSKQLPTIDFVFASDAIRKLGVWFAECGSGASRNAAAAITMRSKRGRDGNDVKATKRIHTGGMLLSFLSACFCLSLFCVLPLLCTVHFRYLSCSAVSWCG